MTAVTDGKSVIVISAPKSGSTFIYQALMQSTGLKPVPVLHCDRRTGRVTLPEADLGLASQIRQSPHPVIAHQHLLPNANTLAFLEESGMRPVIVWRDLSDSMVSLCEEWEQQWTAGFEQIIADGHSLQFLGPVPRSFVEGFLQADSKTRYELVITVALPWYCQFISGWSAVHERAPSRSIQVTYEELAANELGTIGRLASELGSPPTRDLGSVLQGLRRDRVRANINVGRAGRGRNRFSWAQRKRIRAVAEAFHVGSAPGRRDDGGHLAAAASLNTARLRVQRSRKLPEGKIGEKLSLLSLADALLTSSLSHESTADAAMLAAEVATEIAVLRLARGDHELGHHMLCVALHKCAQAVNHSSDPTRLADLRRIAARARLVLADLEIADPSFRQAVTAAIWELARLDLSPAKSEP